MTLLWLATVLSFAQVHPLLVRLQLVLLSLRLPVRSWMMDWLLDCYKYPLHAPYLLLYFTYSFK
jgi:hypothetical protein